MRAAIRMQVAEWIARIENPESAIEQSILDLHESLSRLKRGYVSESATHKRLLAGLERLEARAEDQGDEAAGLGRDAQSVWREIERGRKQVKTHEQLLASLKAGLIDLETKIADSKERREELLARKAQAKAKREVGAALVDAAYGRDSVVGFERMEDEIVSLEAEAATMAEMQKDLDQWGGPLGSSALGEDVEQRLAEIDDVIESAYTKRDKP